jgi:hypothetical protein
MPRPLWGQKLTSEAVAAMSGKKGQQETFRNEKAEAALMFHRRWNGLNLDQFRIPNSDRATQKGSELFSHRQGGSVIVYFENNHTSLAIERNGTAHRDTLPDPIAAGLPRSVRYPT